MPSIKACRALLGPIAEPLSDAEIEAVRDQLSCWYAVVRQQANSLRRATEADVMTLLPADERVDVEERAAIIEFDGGMPRDLATRLAFQQIAIGRGRGTTH